MRRPAFRLCLVPGCNARIEAWRHFCSVHWRMLSAEDRAGITEAQQSRDLARVYRLAAAGASAIVKKAAEAARRIGERADG